ncbi:MAG: Holliday junction branch migration protein RuvA [Bacillota bacterium]
MIGYLKGEIISVESDEVIINVSGVGYQVNLPAAFSQFQVGEITELFIYTYVREDSLELFGFKEKSSKDLFIRLLSVSGIGPRVAENIISTLPPDKFISAILNEDMNTLQQISGIGPKSGQRLILELKDKLDDLIDNAVTPTSNIYQNTDKDLYSALNNLGYNDSEINQAVNKLGSELSGELEDRIMLVLNHLGKE